MIEMEGLRFAYGSTGFSLAIDSMKIEAGSKIAFVGPSGSGKTTLLRLMAGILMPTAGRIRVDDIEVSSLDDARRRRFRISKIGFVFQDFALIDYLDVEENVLLPFLVNDALAWNSAARQRAGELLERMGLADKSRRRVDRLSQGERQRVALCRALAPDPRVLLADEPTGALDPSNKTRTLDLLFEQANETGATLVTVTHDHGLLEGFDRVFDFADLLKPDL